MSCQLQQYRPTHVLYTVTQHQTHSNLQ